MVTVFTPVYNRANTLERLYSSLCSQTYKDFEWLIVNDGSTNSTGEVLANIKSKDHFFNIVVIDKENGGKHTAINRGIKEAKGELFFIADSDDLLPDDSLQIITQEFEKIRNDDSFSGICGIDQDPSGKIIGTGLPADIIDCHPTELRYKYGVQGDLKEVFRTEVLKQYPFPELEGEKFCPEVLVWFRISRKYKMRFLNRTVYTADYQPTGITANITANRMQSPTLSMMTYSEMLTHNLPLRVKTRAAINYWRFRLCSTPNKSKPSVPPLWWWAFPLGLLLHLNDLRVNPVEVRRSQAGGRALKGR